MNGDLVQAAQAWGLRYKERRRRHKRNNFIELTHATDDDVVHLAEPEYRPL